MHQLQTWTPFAGLALTATLLAACDTDERQGQICTSEAYASVSVRVIDEKDEPVVLQPGSVTYAVDGGETRTLDAEFDTLDNPLQIFDGPGSYAVTVAPEGYEPGVISVDVGQTADGCHVVTEERELVLNTATE